MNRSKSADAMLVADLSVCCIWLMCLVNGESNGMGPVSAWCVLPLLRMWLSFLIYRRSRMAIVPILMLALGTIEIFSIQENIAFTLFVAPWLYLIDSLSTLFGAPVVTAATMPDIWFKAGEYSLCIGMLSSIWVILIPLGIYVWRCIRKQNVPWGFSVRKRIWMSVYLVCAVFIENFVLVHFYCSHVSVFFMLMLLMPIPVIFNGGKIEGFLTKGEQAFIMVLTLLGIAYTYGISYSQVSAMTAAVFPAAMFAIFCRMVDVDVRYRDIALILSASFIFVFGQYLTGMFRILMLLLSLALMALPMGRFALDTRRFWTSMAIYVMIAFLLPVFCIGYNPYSVLEARKVRHYDEYEYSSNGLMLVVGNDGFGIRDRYGLILPAEYRWIEHLESTKPYCKVRNSEGWQIYDLVRQELLLDEVFDEVIPYGVDTYLLKSEKGDKYLIMPSSYSRFNDGKVAVMSEFPL